MILKRSNTVFVGILVLQALGVGSMVSDASANDVRITIDSVQVNHDKITQWKNDTFEVITTGADPYVSCEVEAVGYDPTLFYAIRF